MTAIEHKELKGITLRNLIVTVASTASIVASVMTTYFGLKSEIQDIKTSGQMEARINNIRIKILEDRVTLLQHEYEILQNKPTSIVTGLHSALQKPNLFTSIK